MIQLNHPCPWISHKRPNLPAKKVVICGTRTFNQPELLFRKMDEFTFFFDVVEVHIGGEGEREWSDRELKYVRVGADWFANVWAEMHWWTRCIHWPDWTEHKKAAGPIRNREMAKAVAPNGFCVAFWNGKSTGTKSMIEEFCRYNNRSRLRVVRYKGK